MFTYSQPNEAKGGVPGTETTGQVWKYPEFVYQTKPLHAFRDTQNMQTYYSDMQWLAAVTFISVVG